jgi:membrane protein
VSAEREQSRAQEEREHLDQPSGVASEADAASGPASPSAAGAGASRKPFLERIPVVGPAYSLYRGYGRRNGALLSAGLAYYGLFAAGPLILLTLELAGLFVGPITAQEELSETMGQYLGPYLADLFSNIIIELQATRSSTFVWIGAAFLIWAAIRLFMRLQVSFNIMWDVRIRSREFSFRRLLSRLVAFAFILVPTALYLVSLFLNASISWLQDLLDSPGLLLGIAQAVIPFLVAWVALLLIYVILPDLRLSWKDCWIGALAASFCCTVGTWVFGTYLVWSGNQKYVGSVGALIAMIVWANYMAIIVLLGARLNKILYVRRGKLIQPYDYAAIITELPYGEVSQVDS